MVYCRQVVGNDPDEDLWSYYELLEENPIVFNDQLAVILQVALVDKFLFGNVHKAYILPILHPILQKGFQFSLEGEYHTLSSDSDYAIILLEHNILVCVLTMKHLCQMDKTLHATEKISWCLYA